MAALTAMMLVAVLALVSITAQPTAASSVTLTVVGDEDADPIHVSTLSYGDAVAALDALDDATLLSVPLPGTTGEVTAGSLAANAVAESITLTGTSSAGSLTIIAVWGGSGIPQIVFAVDAGSLSATDLGIDGALGDYTFPRAMFYLAADGGAATIAASALPASTVAALDGLYPGAHAGQLALQGGLNVAANVGLSALPTALTSILGTSGPSVLLSGALGGTDFGLLAGSGPAPSSAQLSASLPALDGGVFPAWLSAGPALLSVTLPVGSETAAASLSFGLTADAGGSPLSFQVNSTLDMATETLAFEATMQEPWVAPFGVTWLTLDSTSIAVDVSSAGDVTADLSATVNAGATTVALGVAVAGSEAVFSASIDSLSGSQLAALLSEAAGVSAPSDLPEMTLNSLLLEIDTASESFSLSGSIALLGVSGSVLVSAQERGDGRQFLLGVSTDATTLAALPLGLSGAPGAIPLPGVHMAYASVGNGSTQSIDYDDLTVGERTFFDGVFGLNGTGTSVELVSGVNLESELALAALPAELLDAVGLSGAGSATLSGSLTIANGSVGAAHLGAALPGTPTIPGMPDWFQGDGSTPFTLDVDYDGTDASLGVSAGFLVTADGVDTVPFAVSASLSTAGAVSISGASTAAWPTPFDQQWLGNLDTLELDIALDESGAEASLASTFSIGSTQFGVDLAISGASGATDVTFTATADQITRADLMALLAATGADTDGLSLPDVTANDLVVTATAGTSGFSFEFGGSLSLFGQTDAGLVLSVLSDEGALTVVGGVKVHNISIADVVPETDGTLAGDITAETLALVLSLGGDSVESGDLSPVLRAFFDDIYGAGDYTVELGSGVSLVATIGVPTELDDVLDEFGGLSVNQLRLTGSVPIPWGGGGSSLGVSLTAEIPRLEFATGQGPDWFRYASFSLSIAADATTGSVELSLEGDLAVTIDDGETRTDLLFFTAGNLSAGPTGVSFALGGGLAAEQPWEQPFGIEWLTINGLHIYLSFDATTASLGMELGGDAVFGVDPYQKQLAATVGLELNVATGIPTNFVLKATSTSNWGTSDLVELYRLMDPVGAAALDVLPVFEVRPIDAETPLRVQFALRDSVTVNAGFALEGSLWVKFWSDQPIEEVASLTVDVSTAGIYFKGQTSAPLIIPPTTLENVEVELEATFVPPGSDIRFFAAADLVSPLVTSRIVVQIPFEVDFNAALLDVLATLEDVEQLWADLRPLLEDDPLATFNGDTVDELYASAGMTTPPWIAELMEVIDALPLIEGVPSNPVALVNAVLAGFDITVPPGAGYPVGGDAPDGCGPLTPFQHTDGRCYTITPFAGNEMGFRTVTECPLFQFLEGGKCWTTPPSVTSSVPMQTVCPVGSALEGGRCWVLDRTPDNLAYALRSKVYSCDFLWERNGSTCVWRNVWGTITDSKPAYYSCPALSAEFEGKCYTSPIPGTPTPARNLSTGAEIAPSLGCWEIGHVADYGSGVCWTILGPPTLAASPNPTVRQECSHLVGGIPVFGVVVNGKCYYLGQAPRIGTPVGGADQGCWLWSPFFLNGKCWTIPPTPEVQLIQIPGICVPLDIPCSLAGIIDEAIIGPIVTDIRSDLDPYVVAPLNLPPTVVTGGPYAVNEAGSVTLSAAGSADPEGAPLVIAWDLNNDGQFTDASGTTAVFSAASITGPDVRTVGVRATDPAGNATTVRFHVSVAAVVPTLSVDGAPSVDASAEYTLSLSATDPGGTQTLRWSVDWGDGSSESALLSPDGTLTHVYTGAVLNPVIKVTASDKDGDYSAPDFPVTVIQVDPEVTLSAPPSGSEGSQLAIEGTLFEPGWDDPLTLTVDWGDGTSRTTTAAAGVDAYSATHTYADNGTYTVTVRATNPYGAFDEASSTVVVANGAPTIEVSALVGDEGSTIILEGTVADPGSLDTFDVTIQWGDGESDSLALGAGATAFAATHVYADDALFNVSVTVTDKDGDSDTATTTADIANVVPVLLDAAFTPSPSEEAEEVTFLATLVEPGADVVTVVVDWGDGSSTTQTYQPGETDVVLSHTYLDDPQDDADDRYPVSVTTTDDDGASSNMAEYHSVRNVAPHDLALVLSESAIDEDDEVTLSGTFSDPGVLDTFTVVIDWGDGSEATEISLSAGVQEFEASHVYLDDDPTGVSGTTYTIAVSVTDKDGDVGETSTEIEVRNVGPIMSMTPSASTVFSTEDLDIEVSFTDVGTLDTHTAVIDWGDGTSETADVAQLAGGGSFRGSHRYLNPGTYVITVALTDDDGDLDEQTTELEVLGPRDLIEQAIALMSPYSSPQVNNADRFMNQSLEQALWDGLIRGDERRGHSIFDGVRQGAHQLGLAPTSGPPAQRLSGTGAARGSEASELLARASWILVRVALVDTEEFPSGVPQNRLSQVNREIANALDAFEDGEAAHAAGRYDTAIQDYRSAWQALQRAIAHANR